MNKEDKIISISILGIWVVLLLFGFLTLIKPGWLEKAAKAGINVEASTVKRHADLLLEKRAYSQAIVLYQKAIKLAPDIKGSYANLAMIYYQTGKLSKAIKTYEDLLTQDPDFSDIVYYNLAEIYKNSGNKEKALSYYLKAAETASYSAPSYRKAGKLLMDKKAWGEATDKFQMALSCNPTPSNLYQGMLKKSLIIFKADTAICNKIQETLDDNHFEKVMERYDTSIILIRLSRDPEIAKTYNNLGYCYAMTGKYKEAKQQFKAALKIEPQFTDAINNLGAVNRLSKKK